MKKDKKEIRKARKKRFLRVYHTLPLEEQIRLCVTRTSRHIIAQVIRDATRETIAAASTLEKPFLEMKEPRLVKAHKIGELIAQRALEKGITKLVFDRNGFVYKGQIKAVADGARSAGLQF